MSKETRTQNFPLGLVAMIYLTGGTSVQNEPKGGERRAQNKSFLCTSLLSWSPKTKKISLTIDEI